MTYQDRVIHSTRQAIEDLFRIARAMPADKLEWSVLDQGRTVLDQLQECAQAPGWFAPILITKQLQMPPPDQMQAVMEQLRAERQQWTTIDDCERVCKANSEKFYEAIRGVAESDLEVMVHLPFGGGMDRSVADCMLFHFWNTVYHIGQINFIQTLYGDKEMH